MAEPTTAPEEQTNPTTPEAEAPVQVEKEAPKKPQAVIKVVSIAVDEEYTEPEGWVLKEIHSVDVETGKFFGVLVKVLDYPVPGVRASQKVNLKK